MTPLVAPVLLALAMVATGARLVPTVAGPRRAEAEPSSGRTRRWWRRRPSRAGDTEVAEWCEHVARCLRGGHSLPRALDDAAIAVPSAATEFEALRRSLRRGRSLPAALASLDVDPAHAIGLVVPVLTACAELGGPAAAPLDRVAATLQARAEADAERRASSAQARMSARVLTTLPVAMLAMLAAADPSVRTTLGTPAGVTCLALGGACNLGGWAWMRRLTDGGRT